MVRAQKLRQGSGGGGVAGRVGGDFELCLERRKMGRHWVIKSGD